MNIQKRHLVQIGDFNRLPIVKEVDFGVYLDGGEYETILLPKRYVPKNAKIGDSIDVFLYLDSEDLLIATTEKPKVCVGQCAHLKVKDVNNAGAFLDWGLPKDLLVPYNEQHKPMEVGKDYVVFVYLDEHSDRIVASSKLNRHLSEMGAYFKPWQEVDLLIWGKTQMGYKAIINNSHLGLIFRDEAFKPLKYGQKTKGFIKAVRDDKKIDLALQRPVNVKGNDLSEQIIEHLKKNNGATNITDSSSPEQIYKLFNVSKRNYKKALGQLYSAKKIIIEKDRITLVK